MIKVLLDGVLPIFAIVVIGYTLGKRNIFDKNSPDGTYKNSQESSLVLSVGELEGESFDLLFKTRYALENKYDFAFLEVSYDGGLSWKELEKFNGQKLKWQTIRYSLSKEAGDEKLNLSLRFRLKTDYSIAKEGWWIDEIKILGPQKPQESDEVRLF